MADTQPVFFEIPKSGFNDLAAVAENASHLQEIVALVKTCAIPLSLAKLSRVVSEKTGLTQPAARNILDGFTALCGLMERSKLPADQLVASFSASLEAQAPDAWIKQYGDTWKQAAALIVAALQSVPPDSPISLQQKIRELTYSHQNLLTDLAIFADLRPVYSAAGDKILAMVLTHVLSINYQDGSRRRKIEFAFDAADLTKLFRAAERAQLKVATAKTSLGEQEWALIVAGISDTDSSEASS